MAALWPIPDFSAHTTQKIMNTQLLESRIKMEKELVCTASKKCGGCQYLADSYEKQLSTKQKYIDNLLKKYCKVEPIIGMKDPLYYRNKVHHVFSRDRQGNIITGCYEANSHRVVNVKECFIEDLECQKIIKSIAKMCKSFKIKTYDEDTDYGLLRHVLVRKGFKTGEIMVVLVLRNSVLPGKNNFVKALLKEHPNITTIVLNVNDKHTSMVLGTFSKPIYGPGFIKDELCGVKFRISADSFYQVNPVQTEILYKKAIEMAALTGKERIIDAYCGIGTIGLCASNYAKEVIGVELNKEAVKDAIANCRENKIGNCRFYCADAGDFMDSVSQELSTDPSRKIDVVFMDPPRSGSTEKFIDSVARLNPSKVVYVSCGLDTLARDLKYFEKLGYKVNKIQPVDMFPMTEHVETVVLMSKVK